ncbi:MAG: (2E,6E)-farnesyl diphosphate synthase [Chromatiales bacterium 21-64-14]|nr:MAG: (2E,6E)-farnesyl diphosphate synthase [Chromatiales bacterium 21-64-14]HQU15562.1 (2E,6E)-farnesyl diphosphate synthase [Gammaproteobacteria bacterium]
MKSKPNPFQEWLRFHQARVERSLERWLPSADTHPTHLHEAMRYSVLGSGKRIRPALVYAAGAALDVPAAVLDGPACAVELIHAYSLVHDDLPAMDNDDLRRGKPTCHRAFGEATALLAGDALQSLAFQVLGHDPALQVSSDARLKMVDTLATASGSRGMAGGQAIDLAAEGRVLDLAQLEDMHIHKTGALIRASVLLGAHSAAVANPELLERIDHYGKCIGLAFQIRDDILDVEGETGILGKTQGADAARSKPTYPAVIGLESAKQRAQELFTETMDTLAPLDRRADPLRWIASYTVERNH